MKINVNSVRVQVKKRPWRQNFQKAHEEMDRQIMEDIKPYMPLDTGGFIDRTQAKSNSMIGTGELCIGIGPMGSFLYHGVKMVDSKTKKGPRLIPNVGFRFREGAKLEPTNEPLSYSRAGATARWFDVAKQNREKEWIKIAKRAALGRGK